MLPRRREEHPHCALLLSLQPTTQRLELNGLVKKQLGLKEVSLVDLALGLVDHCEGLESLLQIKMSMLPALGQEPDCPGKGRIGGSLGHREGLVGSDQICNGREATTEGGRDGRRGAMAKCAARIDLEPCWLQVSLLQFKSTLDEIPFSQNPSDSL